MGDVVPPRPDRTSGPRPVESAAPTATWHPIEAIPVFVIALTLGAIVQGVAFVFLKACSPRFVVTTIAGELGFAGAVLGWVRFVSKAPPAVLGLPRRPLLDVGAGVGTGIVLLFAAGTDAEILTWLDDHSRFALQVTAHAPVTGPAVLAAFRAAVRQHGPRPPP